MQVTCGSFPPTSTPPRLNPSKRIGFDAARFRWLHRRYQADYPRYSALQSIAIAWLCLGIRKNGFSMTGLKDILLALVMLPFPLVLGLGAASTRGKWRRRAWLAGAALLMSVGLLKSGVALARNFQSQPLWDFHCYWIYGRTITDGRNPYDPAELAISAAPLETTEEFREELLFFYPPPALFVLAPLGWTDIRTACNLWQLVNIAFFLGNIWLLRRFAATLDSPPGFDVLLCLFLTLRGTADTFVFTQVNFMLLTALLLYWLNRDRLVGGGALAAGILLKPFLAFAPLEIVLAQRWWSLAGGLITALLLCLASWTAFGAEVWKSYLWSNPAALQIPDSMFTEPMNQSLLATVLRITGYQFAEHSPYTHPLFLILLTTITLVTTRGVWRQIGRAHV